MLIAYVSRGLLSSLMEPKQVLAVISSENSRTPHRVIINTYAVVDGKSSVSLLLLSSAYIPHVFLSILSTIFQVNLGYSDPTVFVLSFCQVQRRYRDSAGNTIEENSGVFSLIRMC